MKSGQVRVLRCALAVLVFAYSTAWAQEQRVYQPTELVEMSDVLRADWHRILGKIEGALPDKQQADAVQARVFTWLDESGSGSSKRFEDAQAELAAKFKSLEASMDAARASGNLATWDPKGSQSSALNSQPAQPVSVSASVVPAPSPPPPIAVRTDAPAPSSSAPSVEKPMSPAAQWLTLAITIAGGSLGFFLYPLVFQPRSDQYFRSWIQRLNKRIGITAVFLFFSYLLGGGVARAVLGG